MGAAEKITPREYADKNRRRRAMVAELARRYGMDAADLEHDVKCTIIAVITGGEGSSKALDRAGWARLFAELQDRLDRFVVTNAGDAVQTSAPRPRNGRHPGALPTAGQKQLIEQLAAILGITRENIGTWCVRHMKWRVPIIATRWQASQAIEGMKHMVVIERQLFERAAKLPFDKLTDDERTLYREFGRCANPNKLKAGAVIWMSDLCDRAKIEITTRAANDSANITSERHNNDDAEVPR